jgi:hypothetical protein
VDLNVSLESASVRERMGASTAVKLLIGCKSHFR